MFWLRLARLHQRDAGSAERRSVAIENREVHQGVVENMRHDRGERLSAVNVGKAIVAGEAGRRELDDAANGRKDLNHGGIPIDEIYGCPELQQRRK